MNVSDTYRLPCGHEGKIKFVLEKRLAVVGPIRRPYCHECNPNGGRRTPTVFILTTD